MIMKIMIMMILMMIIIMVITIAIMIMMIEIIIIVVVIINTPFQPGDFSTGPTTDLHQFNFIKTYFVI